VVEKGGELSKENKQLRVHKGFFFVVGTAWHGIFIASYLLEEGRWKTLDEDMKD
jgi:hypothetical protein